MTSRPSDKSPRVSVLMAVYNGEAFLAEAVESVLAQTFDDFEFLIHDDGSTDGSLDVLQTFAAKDARLIVSHGKNQGLPATLNAMTAQARGDLIARFDADDVCLPDRFARQVAWMDAHPNTVVLGGRALVIDDMGRSISFLAPPKTHDEIDRSNLRGNTAFQHPAVMIRRGTLTDVGGYDDSFRDAEDHDLWLRLAEAGQMANLSDLLIKYRIHSNSISGTKRDQQRANCRRACEAAWARRGVSSTFEYNDWRMDDTAESKLEFYLQYAWKAWKQGFRSTWRYYAWESVKLAPGSKDAWKALVLGALKRPRQKL